MWYVLQCLPSLISIVNKNRRSTHNTPHYTHPQSSTSRMSAPPPLPHDGNNNTDPWDDLAIHPHAAAMAEGQRQGSRAGRAAGWRQGYTTGRTTAVEYGTELGFVRGVVETLPQHMLDDDDDTRLRDSIQHLLSALDAFPKSADVFPNSVPTSISNSSSTDPHEPRHDGDSHHAKAELDGDKKKEEGQIDVASDQDDDVAVKMQRVRARFKLLMVQLGVPHFSLKHLMDQCHSIHQQQQQQQGTPPIDAGSGAKNQFTKATAVVKHQETSDW